MKSLRLTGIWLRRTCLLTRCILSHTMTNITRYEKNVPSQPPELFDPVQQYTLPVFLKKLNEIREYVRAYQPKATDAVLPVFAVWEKRVLELLAAELNQGRDGSDVTVGFIGSPDGLTRIEIIPAALPLR